jgi:hypothetical protein
MLQPLPDQTYIIANSGAIGTPIRFDTTGQTPLLILSGETGEIQFAKMR